MTAKIIPLKGVRRPRTIIPVTADSALPIWAFRYVGERRWLFARIPGDADQVRAIIERHGRSADLKQVNEPRPGGAEIWECCSSSNDSFLAIIGGRAEEVAAALSVAIGEPVTVRPWFGDLSTGEPVTAQER